MRRLLGVVAVLAGLLVPLAHAAGPASAELQAGLTYSQGAVSATDNVRAAHDLVALRASSCLSRLAWAQAHRMARRNTLFHQDLGNALRTCDLSYAAENIASGFRSGSSVVYDGWMKSPPHRANLLSVHYRRMAIGAVKGANGIWYVSQVFGRHA